MPCTGRRDKDQKKEVTVTFSLTCQRPPSGASWCGGPGTEGSQTALHADVTLTGFRPSDLPLAVGDKGVSIKISANLMTQQKVCLD